MPSFIKLSTHIYPPKSVDLIPKKAEGIHSLLNSLLSKLLTFKHPDIKILP